MLYFKVANVNLSEDPTISDGRELVQKLFSYSKIKPNSSAIVKIQKNGYLKFGIIDIDARLELEDEKWHLISDRVSIAELEPNDIDDPYEISLLDQGKKVVFCVFIYLLR